jgi:hypothetical protein
LEDINYEVYIFIAIHFVGMESILGNGEL